MVPGAVPTRSGCSGGDGGRRVVRWTVVMAIKAKAIMLETGGVPMNAVGVVADGGDEGGNGGGDGGDGRKGQRLSWRRRR